MYIKSAIFVLILCACSTSLLSTSVAAEYTISDLSGSPINQGQQFTVDITGNPNTAYYVWLTGTWSLSGNAYNQPPFIVPNQLNVQQDPAGGPYTIGSYKYSNGNGRTILDDVAPSSSLISDTSYYALVTTDDSGHAVVGFGTSVNTAVRSYSVRIENPTSPNNGTLLVQRGDTEVTKGSVSITSIVTRPTRPTFPPTTIPTQSPVPIPPETTQVTILFTVPATTTTVPLEPSAIIIALGAAIFVVRRG